MSRNYDPYAKVIFHGVSALKICPQCPPIRSMSASLFAPIFHLGFLSNGHLVMKHDPTLHKALMRRFITHDYGCR
uniref:Uncharacterized protein n=1 Tax=Candidatus Kentrum eta TaxID=2126337 RepID=A0A450VE77_9GAMM|nr:MAG: hypothetical protein BECKH772B_GA0070898_103083 [Candidatus Kentron sp. H]VFK03070.1 MAG: hypothetical protein BECKH772A_GA0070896_103053 [Candidatus Kentron sp. H]VFK05879.1 MAG: hypothetical protein BECKH772C_GA0070978_103083 [Candidatus Kentron sp. H]